MQNPLSEEYISYLVDGEYVFTTDDRRIYSASFEEQPFFSLATIIRKFIQIDPLRIVCFTCDTADGRHLARYKRFNE